jgi:hypothetical protein
MAVYTKQELIDAFCEATSITGDAEAIAAGLVDEEARIQVNIDARISNMQAKLDNMPTAKGRMKQIALQHLAKAAKLQSIADNENVNL